MWRLAQAALDGFRTHPDLLFWLGTASIVTFIGSLVFVPLLIARIPTDYFAREARPRSRFRARHPVARIGLLVLKNAAGYVLLAAGLAMLVLPGQGLITMFIGFTLVDFPGKFRLERRIMRQRPVARGVNWIRARVHRPPLEV